MLKLKLIVHTKPIKGVLTEFEPGYIYLENSYFKKLYDHTFKSRLNKPWKRPAVKIVTKDKDGNNRTIRCLFRSGVSSGITENDIGLSPLDASTLDLGSGNIAIDFKLGKGSKFFYYWYHPLHYNRVSFKIALILGVLSLLISISSIIVSFFI